MGLISLVCSVCHGTGHVRGGVSGRQWICAGCRGAGRVLVHTGQIGQPKHRIRTLEQLWSEIEHKLDGDQLELFSEEELRKCI